MLQRTFFVSRNNLLDTNGFPDKSSVIYKIAIADNGYKKCSYRTVYTRIYMKIPVFVYAVNDERNKPKGSWR